MIIGLDFGTTNTGAATFDGRSIHLLPSDPANSTPTICRTAVYITRGLEYYLGSQAMQLYFEQNLGRPTRFRKVKVGEIMQIFADLPVFYRDVYVYEDEFSPGRLFVSIKTALRKADYYGTVFLNHWYSASDLAAIFLSGIRLRINRHLGREVKAVVLGRPVHFSTDPSEDKVAQGRLLEAAFNAGFEQVYLEYEPVAAALAYERGLKDKETVLVFDFGGGTLDFTIMEIGRPTRRQVFASGGIPIAGDVFDQRLFRATIPRHLGENDEFVQGGMRYPIPAHIFDLLSSPQEVLSLNTPYNLDMLRSIHQGAVHKQKTQALLQVVSSNYALYLYDLVERAKRQLSIQNDTRVSFQGKGFSIEEQITRLQFEQVIQRDEEMIREELLATLDRSGLKPRDIDRVIRTGGSSQIPRFVQLLNDLFGMEKVREIDTFSSVTAGLAIQARAVAEGQTDLPLYTPGSSMAAEESQTAGTSQPQVSRIDLGLVRRRLDVGGDGPESPVGSSQIWLLALTNAGLRLYPLDGSRRVPATASPADAPGERLQAALARPEGHLLLATSLFRLINIPIQSLLLARQVGDQGIRDLLHLEPEEAVTALLPWNPESPPGGFLCLVTSQGQARGFDARLLADQVLKRPFFQLERRYLGVPAAMIQAAEGQRLLVGTSSGRAGQAWVRDMKVLPVELLKIRKSEALTAVGAFAPDEAVLAAGETGVCLPVPLSESSSRVLALKRGFRILGFLPAEGSPSQAHLGLTTHWRILPLTAKTRLQAGEVFLAKLTGEVKAAD